MVRASSLLVLFAMLVGARAEFAKAQPPGPSASDAIAAIRAIVDPFAKLKTGPDRTARACAALDPLKAAAKAMPAVVPAKSAIDPAIWAREVGTLNSTVVDLAKTCKAPDKRVKLHGSDLYDTVDDNIEALPQELNALADQAQPRTLTPAMKGFDQVLRKAVADKPKHKQWCKTTPALAKVEPGLKEAPTGADKAKWEAALDELEQGMRDVVDRSCGGLDDANAYDGGLDKVHESFAKLVLLLPVDK